MNLSVNQKDKVTMGAVRAQTGKGAADVWTSVWTVKLLASGQVKDVARPVKKVAKVDVRKGVKTPAKEVANLVHKRTLHQVVLEESIFLIQLGVRNPLVYLGGMQVTQMEI